MGSMKPCYMGPTTSLEVAIFGVGAEIVQYNIMYGENISSDDSACFQIL